MINTEKRWGIKLKKEIFSDVNELWKIISTPGHLEKIHPYCKSNNTIKWSGKNSIDILIYLNGMRYVREFKSWNPKKGFSLVIGEENKEKSYVEWEISNANNKTYLAITVYPYFMKNYNKLISLLPYQIFIKPNLIKYLNNVIDGINWHIKNKVKVPNNNFGKHKWFSDEKRVF